MASRPEIARMMSMPEFDVCDGSKGQVVTVIRRNRNKGPAIKEQVVWHGWMGKAWHQAALGTVSRQKATPQSIESCL